MINIEGFLDAVSAWASSQDNILAVGLVGSWARGAARADSDVDLIIITISPDEYLESNEWIAQFGAVRTLEDETYGPIFRSRRVYYHDGMEVEFGLTTADWAAMHPVDSGTQQVVSGGMIVLYDPSGLLAALTRAVADR